MNRSRRTRRAHASTLGAWAVLALLLGALAGCTGTFEEGAPLVLLVATEPSEPGDGGAIVAYLVEPPDAATLRSVTPIGPADLAPDVTLPIQAWDWVDREALGVGPGLGRTRLVVLASDTATAIDARRALLHRYDLAAFDPATPTLAPVGATPISLVDAGAWDEASVAIGEGVSLPNGSPCLTGTSVSSTGRYVALLDQPTACGSSDLAALLVLDMTGPVVLVWASSFAGVAPVRPYVDQANDRLDVWDLVPGGAEWRTLDLVERELGPRLASSDGGVPVDVTAAGEERWVLAGGRLTVWRPGTAPGAGVASATGDGAAFVPTGAGLAAVVLDPDLWVHRTPTAEASRVPGPAGRYATGVTDAPDRLVYLVREGVIDTLDLLVMTPDEPLSRVISPAFRDPSDDPRLTDPTLVTWFRPRPPPTP